MFQYLSSISPYLLPAHTLFMSNYLKLEFDQPEVIALKYPTPKPARDGFNGESQVRWMLMDGRAFYTPAEFQSQVEVLKIRAGERFEVLKTREGRNAVLKVRRIAQPVSQLLDSGDLEGYKCDVSPVPPTKLESALKTAVSAAASAEKHGQQIGYTIRFQPQDIRAMAISVLIGMRDAA